MAQAPHVRASQWFKVDLQVASPGGGFRLSGSHDLGSRAGRDAAASAFVQLCIKKGLDAVALADHNSGDWVDPVKAAAENTALTVFPGVEVTTGSGQDGIHLLILGDESITSRDIDVLLHSTCGFGPEHPTHKSNGEPLPSPTSLFDILSSLSDSYMVIAPHAFSENGIARMESVNKAVRCAS